MLVAVCADRRIVPVTNWPLTVMVSAAASPRVVLPVLVSVVNVPASGVVAPIDMLLIVPAVPELIVIVPAPVVVYDCALVVVLMVTAPVADSVVNAPVDAVVAPIDMLLIVPTPVDVRARVGVVLAVSVIKFVYAAPSVS